MNDTNPSRPGWREPLVWVDSRDWPARERDPLPLVVFPSEGLYRRQMTEALDGLGRRWRIAYISASLASLQGAVSAGIGVSLLPKRLMPADLTGAVLRGAATESPAPLPEARVLSVMLPPVKARLPPPAQ